MRFRPHELLLAALVAGLLIFAVASKNADVSASGPPPIARH